MFFKHTKWAMLWALVILVLCGMPGRDIPHISFLEMLSFDKVVHAGIFFVLFALMVRGFILQSAYKQLHDNAKGVALIIGISYGGVLEILQGLVFEERSADVYDFAANSIGCLIAWKLYNRVEELFLKRMIK